MVTTHLSKRSGSEWLGKIGKISLVVSAEVCFVRRLEMYGGAVPLSDFKQKVEIWWQIHILTVLISWEKVESLVLTTHPALFWTVI